MNHKFRVSCLVLLAIAVRAAGAGAQGVLLTQPLDSGILVRAQLVGGGRVQGRLLSRLGPSDRGIEMCRYPGSPCTSTAPPGREIVLPLSNVTRLEIAVGSRTWRGALVGGLSALLGAVVGDAVLAGGAARRGYPGVLVGCLASGAVLGAILGSTEIVWGPAP